MIQVFRPKLNADRILESLKPILNSGWIGLGPKTAEFEKKVGEYLDVDFRKVIALNSCTSALYLALKSLGLGKKSRVLTTPITFVSTNHVIRQCGLTPVFYDVDKTTGCVDVGSFNKMCKAYNVSAAMIVHLAGYPTHDMDRINAIAQANGVRIIEDCAHAFGAKYVNGSMVGNSRNICCFSFHAVKNLPMGDGGLIVNNNERHRDWFNQGRWLGITKDTHTRSSGGYSWQYDLAYTGWKLHMNDIAAVIGLCQLETIERDNKRRRQIAKMYHDGLKGVVFPDYDNIARSSCHFYPVFFEDRERVYRNLVKHDIYPGMHYMRNDNYKMYRKCAKDDSMSGTTWYESRELTLPIHLCMSDGDVEEVIKHARS